MKAVILAGGYGTRLGEETIFKPKPLVEIGGMPILWHIMKIYSFYGINDFIICLGYKGNLIKNFFLDYSHSVNNIEINLDKDSIKFINKRKEPWTITLIDTGGDTMTGGRVKKVSEYINETFLLTYGDGVSNVNIKNLIEFHKNKKRISTVTAVRPDARFGGIKIGTDMVTSFKEKPQSGEGWINGGFFVFEPKFLDYIDDDSTVLEHEPLEIAAKNGQLSAFKHEGFWQCMDTIRDRDYLNKLWNENNAKWKIWK